MTRFNLPVFTAAAKPSTPEELFRRALHAEEIYQGALGDTVMLESGGVAIVSRDFPGLSEANQIRQVSPPTAEAPASETIASVNAFFHERKLTCRQWSFVGGQVPPEFGGPLESAGYVRQRCDLWLMASPTNLDRRGDLTVIPGRASFSKLADLAESAERAWGTTNEANLRAYRETSARYLDDPRVDNLLALAGDTPVGTAYLVTAGEAGLIEDLYVHPAHTRKGVATTLLNRLVELAARSRHRHLLLLCASDNTAARALYTKVGFTPIYQAESLALPSTDTA